MLIGLGPLLWMTCAMIRDREMSNLFPFAAALALFMGLLPAGIGGALGYQIRLKLSREKSA
jgi:hypothetical protein